VRLGCRYRNTNPEWMGGEGGGEWGRRAVGEGLVSVSVSSSVGRLLRLRGRRRAASTPSSGKLKRAAVDSDHDDSRINLGLDLRPLIRSRCPKANPSSSELLPK